MPLDVPIRVAPAATIPVAPGAPVGSPAGALAVPLPQAAATMISRNVAPHRTARLERDGIGCISLVDPQSEGGTIDLRDRLQTRYPWNPGGGSFVSRSAITRPNSAREVTPSLPYSCEMRFDRSRADAQFRGDVARRETIAGQTRDPSLGRGQSERGRAGQAQASLFGRGALRPNDRAKIGEDPVSLTERLVRVTPTARVSQGFAANQ